MKRRIYTDTSVIGGCFDAEFSVHSEQLFERFRAGLDTLVLSDLTLAELAGAPPQVRISGSGTLSWKSAARGRSCPMKKPETFDAVRFMRQARDRMSAAMSDMSFEEQRAYIEERAAKLRRELDERRRKTTAA